MSTDRWMDNENVVHIYTHIYIYNEWIKNEWMDKEDVVCVNIYIYTYTHTYTMEYYSAIKMNEIMPFATTWMDLEIIILSEVSQTEKDKYHMISLICRI